MAAAEETVKNLNDPGTLSHRQSSEDESNKVKALGSKEFGAFPYKIAGLEKENERLKAENERLKADKTRLIDQSVAFITVENVQEYIKKQDDNKEYDIDHIKCAIEHVCGMGMFEYEPWYEGVYDRLKEYGNSE